MEATIYPLSILAMIIAVTSMIVNGIAYFKKRSKSRSWIKIAQVVASAYCIIVILLYLCNIIHMDVDDVYLFLMALTFSIAMNLSEGILDI